MSFPQLRVRTGYSFKSNYGHLDDIVSRLKELNANYAAIVDNSTWGHVRFDKAIRKAEITPGFGAEIPIVMNGEDYKPRAWILAKNTRRMYNASTRAAQNGALTPLQFASLTEVVRFSGGAVETLFACDSACAEDAPIDYIDINPSSLTLASRGCTGRVDPACRLS
jgi:hypothetical protein